MTSSSASSLPCPPKYATRRCPERTTHGGNVAKFAEALGTPLMPWQRYVADVALEVNPETGLLVYRTVIVTVPRQSGKTTLLLAVASHRALGFGSPQHIAYSAQTGLDARKKFVDDWLPVLQRSPLASAFTVRLTNGQEQIRWRNGSRHGIVPTTATAAHGSVLDLAFCDEAFALPDDRMEQAFGPAMVTRPEPQLWIDSTAGTDDSEYLNSKIELGRELAERGVTSDVAYFEWSADLNADAGHVSTWVSCMPALRHDGNPTGTTPIEAVAAQYATMSLPEFSRAYLNLRDSRRAESVIGPPDWQECENQDSTIVGALALAFDVAPDRGSAAIAAAGENEHGDDHVEVVDHHAGTGWLVARLAELAGKHTPTLVVCDAAGPAGAFLADLDAAGVEIRVMNTREAIAAAGGFYDAAIGHTLAHIGQPELTAAVDGADRRHVADSWLWSRKTSAVDITTLVAATNARWASRQGGPCPSLSVW